VAGAAAAGGAAAGGAGAAAGGGGATVVAGTGSGVSAGGAGAAAGEASTQPELVAVEADPKWTDSVEVANIFTKPEAERLRIEDALLAALEADTGTLSEKKVRILYTLFTTFLALARTGWAERTLRIFITQLKTLRADVGDDVLNRLAYICLQHGNNQPTTLGYKLAAAILDTLRPFALANPRVACIYLSRYTHQDAEVYDEAMQYCYGALVHRGEPVTGFLLRLVSKCLWYAYANKALGHSADARFFEILLKCGPSGHNLNARVYYASRLVQTDLKAALELTMPYACQHQLEPYADGVRLYTSHAQDSTQVRLLAWRWLNAKLRRPFIPVENDCGRTSFSAVCDLIEHLAGYSEEVARGFAGAPFVRDFVALKPFRATKIAVMTRLVFWWAQVQWQVDNLPTTNRVLDIKTSFNPKLPALSFKTVIPPERIPLDVPCVLTAVIEAANGMHSASIVDTKKSVVDVLRMVYGVMPAIVLENAAACTFILDNPAAVPDMYAAVLLATKRE
jgi:hypothetical protein